MPTISIGFQIQNSGNGFQDLILDADKFKNLIAQTIIESKKLDNQIINFGSLSRGLDSLSSAFQQLQGFTKDLSSAYDTQMEAERQLEQVMKNSMDARAEDNQKECLRIVLLRHSCFKAKSDYSLEKVFGSSDFVTVVIITTVTISMLRCSWLHVG